jgi:hypothetical protein
MIGVGIGERSEWAARSSFAQKIENHQILRPNDPWIAAAISAPSAPL